MSDSPEIVFIERPFQIETLPLKNIYVLDNWLCSDLHHYTDEQISRGGYWAKSNEVSSRSKTGLPHHQFWGASVLVGFDENKNPRFSHEMDKQESYYLRHLNRRLQTEFGFKWERFQYMGLNSQTQGLHGTAHSDCSDEDEWNLSFLYYTNTFWSKHWGGPLRIYDEMQQGLHGRDDHIKNHQIAEIEFVPNRLVVFDGRIPHGADAPTHEARYIDRKSIVIRGDEIRLVEDKEWFKQCPQ